MPLALATLLSGMFVGGTAGAILLAATDLELESFPGTIVAFLTLWAGFAFVPALLLSGPRRDPVLADLGPSVRWRDAAWLPLARRDAVRRRGPLPRVGRAHG